MDIWNWMCICHAFVSPFVKTRRRKAKRQSLWKDLFCFTAVRYVLVSTWNETELTCGVVWCFQPFLKPFRLFKYFLHHSFEGILRKEKASLHINIKVYSTSCLKCKSKILRRWAKSKWHIRYIQIHLLMLCCFCNPKSKCLRAYGKVCSRDFHLFSPVFHFRSTSRSSWKQIDL